MPLFFLLCGAVLTVRLRFIQVRRFGSAVRTLASPHSLEESGGGISQRGALTSALAATLGTGSIVGVATALASGGPGAIFWIWVSGFLGMATHYAETVLAIKYRKKTKSGFSGGPMYYISKKLGPAAGAVYCAALAAASFGIGNLAQLSSICSVVGAVTPAGVIAVGSVTALLAAPIIFGGSKKLEKLSLKSVPVMAGLYLALLTFVILKNLTQLPLAFASIFEGAFSARALRGGAAGSAVLAIRYGVARGVFANEAGLGSSVIMHAETAGAAAEKQGLTAMTEVFFDTLILCTVSALAILCCGIPGRLTGGALTSYAVESALGTPGKLLLSAVVLMFSFTSVVGWSHYGSRASEFLGGETAAKVYRIIFIAALIPAGLLGVNTVWQLCDILNAVMAVPNLLSLTLYSYAAKKQ